MRLFITIYLLFCASNLIAQNELIIPFTHIDSYEIFTKATQTLDSEESLCEYRDFFEKEINSDNFRDKNKVSKYPNYIPSNISLSSDNIKEVKDSNFYKMSCIFKKKKYFYINGTDSFPFEYRPKYLRVRFNKRVNEISIDSLFKELKLERVDDVTSSYTLLKKKNRGKFKDYNCKELKALRESEIIRCAGPLCGTGFFSNDIIIEISDGNEEKIIKLMKKKGFVFIKKNETVQNCNYIFKTSNSIGYGVVKIMNKLIKHPDIIRIQNIIYAPTKYL